MKRVIYDRRALKALRFMPPATVSRIRAKIDQYAQDPSSLAGNIVKLQGRPGFRMRVGDYRVIFDEDGSVLDILDIGHRSSIYE